MTPKEMVMEKIMQIALIILGSIKMIFQMV